MNRLFADHHVRRSQSLDGAWLRRFDPEDIGERDGWFRGITGGEHVFVPSAWAAEFGNLTYDGAVWYGRDFDFDGGCLRLVFEAVMTSATVWLDGEMLGEHYGGFSAFSFIVPELEAGTHTLVVRADNRFDADSIPQIRVDWYHYGGIIRSVTAERIDGLVVLNARADVRLAESLDEGSVSLSLELYRANASGCDRVAVTLDGAPFAEAEASLAVGEYKTVTLDTVTIEQPRIWDVHAPELYTLAVKTDTDDLIDRIGFRRIEVKDGEMLLNGKVLRIRGVCRHEEHPDFGFALPPTLEKRDLDIILDMGCNAIRGSHYPNSKIFLDYLDETGILFWSEIPIWGCGFSVAALAREKVLARGLAMHREMTDQYMNHPAIIIWGMHNEIESGSREARHMTELFSAELRERGGNRLITHASNHPMDDICFDLSDIICLNLYYGWYSGGPEAWSGALDEFRARREALGLADRPVIMSEFGAAAIFGHHTFDDIPWTEEYQARLMEHCLTLFDRDPMMRGTFIWQFSDIRTSAENGLNRARGYNNKGLINEYRRPKQAYHTVRRIYREMAEREKQCENLPLPSGGAL